MKYLSKDDLYYEVLISKFKGQPTDKLKDMFILLIENVANKFLNSSDPELLNDQKVGAYLILSKNWNRFNEDKYNDAFPYYSELVKRSFTATYNFFRYHTKESGVLTVGYNIEMVTYNFIKEKTSHSKF